MVSVLRQLVFVMAFAAVLPWPQSCFAAGLDGWGARYALAEQSRLQANEAKRVSSEAQGLVATDSPEAPAAKAGERSAAVEVLRVTASILVPGLGIVLWLMD